MTLILLSGRPGSGKTAFATWLAQHRGFTHIETDADNAATVNDLMRAFERFEEVSMVRAKARELGEKVVIEWGFRVDRELHFVRQLRLAGFDPWWFDGDETAARLGYMAAKGESAPIHLYWEQVNAIEAARPKLERFYGDHIIRTVTPGPDYMPFEEIASIMLPDDAKD